MASPFDPTDLERLNRLGISQEEVARQMELLARDSSSLCVDRPCTVGDGILRISGEDALRYAAIQEAAAESGRFMKFVPASGAATRMFRTLLAARDLYPGLHREDLLAEEAKNEPAAAGFMKFIRNIRRFAFCPDLEKILSGNGRSLESLDDPGGYMDAWAALLGREGLDYGSMPKALLKFHRYNGHARTPFEEHLVEAALTCGGGKGAIRLHFTVQPDHEPLFRDLFSRVGKQYESRHGAAFQVEFSHQKPSTDTIAVDPENRPFRLDGGGLLFRPGGHGALLENLNDLRGDLVYIKNIDNVVPDHLKEDTIFWKKVLGGLLVSVEEAARGLIRDLRRGGDGAAGKAVAFIRGGLGLTPSPACLEGPAEARARALLEWLDRPMRVCGMVKNTGEPGGGPFWVESANGAITPQIVEGAQIDARDPGQKARFEASTHFNPVDLVCAVRDADDEPYDLKRFVDPEAVFISRKSKDGRDLKALELPGLWNGSMAGWITLFVEVPISTFSPVKTVFDLLRPEHQAEGRG